MSNSLDLDQDRHSVLCCSLSRLKLFEKGHWQTTKLSAGMQRVITGKYFSVQYIVSYSFQLGLVYVYTINIRTL